MTPSPNRLLLDENDGRAESFGLRARGPEAGGVFEARGEIEARRAGHAKHLLGPARVVEIGMGQNERFDPHDARLGQGPPGRRGRPARIDHPMGAVRKPQENRVALPHVADRRGEGAGRGSRREGKARGANECGEKKDSEAARDPLDGKEEPAGGVDPLDGGGNPLRRKKAWMPRGVPRRRAREVPAGRLPPPPEERVGRGRRRGTTGPSSGRESHWPIPHRERRS